MTGVQTCALPIFNVWNNDNNETIEHRLKRIKDDTSPEAFEVTTSIDGETLTYVYRLNEIRENSLVYAVYGFVFSNHGHIQVAAYFNVESDYQTVISVINEIGYAPS